MLWRVVHFDETNLATNAIRCELFSICHPILKLYFSFFVSNVQFYYKVHIDKLRRAWHQKTLFLP